MPLNLLKTFPHLLDLIDLNEGQRIQSLRSVFNRDIENNPNLRFRTKVIRPVKGEEPSMSILFRHLTTVEIDESNDDGTTYKRRVFELDRSRRLHWIRAHIDETVQENVSAFSVEERDIKKRKDVIKTYIYNSTHQYIIVLEPQRSNTDYYLLSAYHLNRPEGIKTIQKKIKKRLPDIQ